MLTFSTLYTPCRQHIESLLAQAAAAEVQSDLAKRVGGWRSRIEPMLAQEEARPGFDMHVYGARLMDRLQGKEDGEEVGDAELGLKAGML